MPSNARLNNRLQQSQILNDVQPRAEAELTIEDKNVSFIVTSEFDWDKFKEMFPKLEHLEIYSETNDLNITGTIDAQTIIVEGNLHGNIKAYNAKVLGNVNGNISAINHMRVNQ